MVRVRNYGNWIDGLRQSSRKPGRRRSPRVEALESRCLLAADPIITEFLASSTRTLAANGTVLVDPPDWIEIYNSGDESIDLQGWHLTDNAGNLTKWTFPSVTLGPHEYLIVNADDAPAVGEPPGLPSPQLTWDAGGNGTDWFAAANWSPDGDPTAGGAYSVNLRIDSGAPEASINVNVQSGSSIVIDGGDVLWSARFHSVGNVGLGTLYVLDGTLTRNTSSTLSRSFNIGNAAGGDGLVDQRGGTLNVLGTDPDVKIGNQNGAKGEYRISGGSMDVAGSVILTTGTGTGTFRYIGADAVVAVGGDYAAVQAIGATDTTIFELDGAARTIIPVAGNVDLSGSKVRISAAADHSIIPGTTFTLFRADSDGVGGGSLTAPAVVEYDSDVWNVTVTPGEEGTITAQFLGEAASPVGLFTGFKLDGGGEYLALVAPNGQTVVSEFGAGGVDYPIQFEDVSYGLPQADASTAPLNRPAYFTAPSPGAPNGLQAEGLGPAISAVTHLPAVPASTEAVVVTAEVVPSVDAITSVALHYRAMYGGEVVVAMNSVGGGVYEGVIPAGAAAPGEMLRYFVTASDVGGNDSRAPLFLDQIGQNQSAEYFGTVVADPSAASALPIMQWFVNPSQIAALDDINDATYENGARTSLFYDGQFYDNVHGRTRGFSVRKFNPLGKLSYKLDFNANDFFTFLPGEAPVEEINLNSNAFDRTKLRLTIATEIMAAAGVPSPTSYPFRLERNGEFFQLSNVTEEPDEYFLKRVGLDGDGALYKMYNRIDSVSAPSGSSPLAVKKKTRRDEGLSDLQSLVDGLKLSGTARTNFIFDNVDVPSVINYMAARIGIVSDGDSHQKNFYLYRDTEGSGLWTMIPWDPDLSLGHGAAGVYSMTIVGDRPLTLSDVNQLIRAVHETPELAEMYRRRVRTLADELLLPPGTDPSELWIEQRIDELVAAMAPDAALDFAKWGVYDPQQDLFTAAAALKQEYFAVRRDFLASHPDLSDPIAAPAPVFGAIEYNPPSTNQDEEYIEIMNPHESSLDLSGWTLGGGVTFVFPPGTVIPAGATAYVSPNLAAFRERPASPSGGEGLLAIGPYDGHISNAGETIELRDRQGALRATIATPNTESDNQRFLRVTELNYHPTESESTEFIELKNMSDSVTLDLNGVRITDGPNQPFAFATSNVTSLAPGAFVLVVSDLAAFTSAYPSVDPAFIAGAYSGALANGGERVKINDADNSTILDFAYEDGDRLGEENWPSEADGAGFSLVIVDPLGAAANWETGAGWRSSSLVGGSPGADDPAIIPGDFNGDGAATRADLVRLVRGFGQTTGATRTSGDANRDRAVTLVDLALLQSSQNAATTSPSPSASAAPASAPLISLRSARSRSAIASRLRAAAVDEALTVVNAESPLQPSIRLQAVARRIHR